MDATRKTRLHTSGPEQAMVRCFHCGVKTLMEQPCRFCVKVQCLKHRTPEDHTCKGDLREKVVLDKVVKPKVDKI